MATEASAGNGGRRRLSPGRPKHSRTKGARGKAIRPTSCQSFAASRPNLRMTANPKAASFSLSPSLSSRGPSSSDAPLLSVTHLHAPVHLARAMTSFNGVTHEFRSLGKISTATGNSVSTAFPSHGLYLKQSPSFPKFMRQLSQ